MSFRFTAGRFTLRCADPLGQQWTLDFQHNSEAISVIQIIPDDELPDLEYLVRRAISAIESRKP